MRATDGRRTSFVLACVLGIAAPLLGAKSEALRPEQIIKRWKDGPVRYLLTGEEEDTLNGLHTVGELARFITGFWERRDPSPGTFQNEYRQLFWQRVAEANKRFRVSTTPGWKTDRGKVFILLGEPFDIEKLGQGDRERWAYRRTHSKIANPEFYIVFALSHGEMVMDNTSAALSPYYDFQGLVSDPGAVGLGGAHAFTGEDQAALITATAVQANYDLGEELTKAVSDAELATEMVSAREFVTAFSATPKVEYFRAKDGTTFVNIGALVRAEDLYGKTAAGLSRARIYARLVPADASKPTQFASNENNPTSFDLSKGCEPGGVFAVWTGTAVPPGAYTLTMAIEESLTGRLGRTAATNLQVPEFSESTLAISTPVLASALTEAKDRMGVTARSSGVYRRSEDLGIYYEVYGLPQAGGTASFDVSYRFSRITAEGTEPIGRAIPFPGRTEAAQGWSFPLAKWPPGKYQIEIDVTDADRRTASARVPFEIVAGEER